MITGFKLTAKEEGMRGLAKGWAPTLIGYSMQGLCKFGFYEVFKIFYANLLGEVQCTYNATVELCIFLKMWFILCRRSRIHTEPVCTSLHQPVRSSLLTLLCVLWSLWKWGSRQPTAGAPLSGRLHLNCGRQRELQGEQCSHDAWLVSFFVVEESSNELFKVVCQECPN